MAVAATTNERREKKAKAPKADVQSESSTGSRTEEDPLPGEAPEGQDPPAEAEDSEDENAPKRRQPEAPDSDSRSSPRKNNSLSKRNRAGPCAGRVCGIGATCVPTEDTKRGFNCQCGTGAEARLMPPAFPCITSLWQRLTKQDRPRQRRRQGSRSQTHTALTSSSSSSSSSPSTSNSNPLGSSDTVSPVAAKPNKHEVCKDNPCGKEPACHPDESNPRGFICVCINSSHVLPGATCEHTIVNVTPSAVPLPLHNATGIHTRALQKGAGLQDAEIPQNTRLQQFEASSSGALGAATGSGIGIALMFCVAVLTLLLSAIAFWRRRTIADVVRRRRRASKGSAQVLPMSLMKDRNFASNPNYYAEPLEPSSPFQALAVQFIDKEQISFVGQLGEGCFGKVYKGVYGPRDVDGRSVGGQTVAVKVLKESAGGEAEADFLREVEIMAAFAHSNILTLVGIVAADSVGPPWMVFEFMALGDLAELLRSRSPDYRTDDSLSKTMTKEDLVSISVQIAAGMTYLSSQHFVHRDLACRNCLVGDNLTVKISDFGMSRDIYTCDYYKMEGSRMLPVRWMPPESLVYAKFTLESDVWSFGVVLWEIYAFGKQPYYGHTNEEVLKLILQGILLQPPKGCPPPICDVMRKCWSTEARDRLQFSQIEELLLKIQKNTVDPSRVLGVENKSLSPEQARLPEELRLQQQQADEIRAWGGVTYSELMAQAEGDAVDADDYLLPKVHPPVEYLTVLNVD